MISLERKLKKKKINKSDIVKSISEKFTLLDNKDIEEGISVIINYASDCLSKNYRIELRGLGSFSLRKRKPRFSRNPKTGDSVFIDSKYYLYFRPSKNLKTLVNE